MATLYNAQDLIKQNKARSKKPVTFKYALTTLAAGPESTTLTLEDFTEVLYLGHDSEYGDVFQAWGRTPNEFIILFGDKGDYFQD